MKKFVLITYIFSFVLFSFAFAVEKYRDKQISIEIVPATKAIEKGKENLFAVKVKLTKGWHIYWQNPGDAGEPTILEISTNIPNQQKIIPQYPVPTYKNTSGLVTLEYRDVVYFPFYLWIPQDFDKKDLEIQLKAKWLVCKHICIPGKAIITKKFQISNGNLKFLQNNEILNSLKFIPKDTILGEIKLSSNSALLKFPLNFEDRLRKVFFYPITEGVFDLELEPEFSTSGNELSMRLPFVRYIWGDTSNIEGVVEFTFDNGKKKYFVTKFVK